MADDGAEETPVRGVVMVFIDEQGRPICEATDFDGDSYGGFKLMEAQRMRCKAELARVVCRAYASPQLVRGIDQYRAEEILRNLVRDHGCKVRTVYVGYEDARGDNDAV